MTDQATTIPAFIAKLWEMVNDPSYDDLIQWCKKGTSFTILDQNTFCAGLLPLFYKHNNMASFIRQLNKYGFRKVASLESASLKNDKNDLEFSHPYFLKNCPELLIEIKRKITTNTTGTKEETYPAMLGQLAKEVLQLQQNQSMFESKLCAMKNENTALWREHSILRQKHQNLQKVLNKLIQFILALVQQTRGMNIKRINMPLMIKSKRTEGLASIKDHSSDRRAPTINENCLLGSSSSEIIIPEIIDDSGNSILINLVDEGSTSNDNSSVVAVPLQEVSPAIVYGKPCGIVRKSQESNITTNTNITDKRKRKYPQDIVINKQVRSTKTPDTAANPKMSNTIVIRPSPVPIASKTSNGSKSTLPQQIVVTSSQPQSLGNKPNRVTVKPIATSSDNSKSLLLKGNSKQFSPSEFLIPPSGKVKLESPPDITIDGNNLIITDAEGGGKNVQNFQVQPEEAADYLEDLASVPIIQSPSGSELSPAPTDVSKQSDSNNESNSLVQSLEPLQKDIDNRIETIQSDLNVLRDLLQTEGISIDASTLINLFNDDPLSFNMPEAAGLPPDNSFSNNELISYTSPSLLDIVDSLVEPADDSDCPEYTDPVPTPTLNTPKPEFSLESIGLPPSKQMKK